MHSIQTKPTVNVISRHIELTDALRDYAVKKVEGLHLEYPRIIEARVVLDVEKNRNQIAELVLFCANHITLRAATTHEDLYAAIDETLAKIARRMRKYKTRLMKRSRPRSATIRHFTEQVYSADLLGGDDGEPTEAGDAVGLAAMHVEAVAADDEHHSDVEPCRIHEEPYAVRPLFREEAIVELEVGDLPFLIFSNAKTGQLSVMYRRSDGDIGLIEPGA